MKLRIFQIDAFTIDRFSGNPAAVIPLEESLEDELMQNIAMENNLSETVFYLANGNNEFEIRWFTPTVEVDLCGHATLACAHVIFEHYKFDKKTIYFQSKSGVLEVSKAADEYTMIFPTDQIKQVTTPIEISKAFNIESLETYKGRDDYMIVVESERVVAELNPDFKTLAHLGECRGVIVTAKGQEVDFVSRCFFPQSGVDEDPATGSAHTTMTPYWAKKLKKDDLTAMQLSKRKGFLKCKYLNEYISISGKARTYLIGDIFI